MKITFSRDKKADPLNILIYGGLTILVFSAGGVGSLVVGAVLAVELCVVLNLVMTAVVATCGSYIRAQQSSPHPGTQGLAILMLLVTLALWIVIVKFQGDWVFGTELLSGQAWRGGVILGLFGGIALSSRVSVES